MALKNASQLHHSFVRACTSHYRSAVEQGVIHSEGKLIGQFSTSRKVNLQCGLLFAEPDREFDPVMRTGLMVYRQQS